MKETDSPILMEPTAKRERIKQTSSYLEVTVASSFCSLPLCPVFVKVSLEPIFSEGAVWEEVTKPAMEPNQPPSSLVDQSFAFTYLITQDTSVGILGPATLKSFHFI